MIKRTPSRNPRSKGIKGKYVLQVCLLLGVCFWLIYQVKHSHDKKKEFEETDTTISFHGSDEVLKFGRKDLHPRVPEVTKNEKVEDDEEDEAGVEEEVNKEQQNKHEKDTKREEEQEEDGNKHEEDEVEEENRHEEEEQEEAGNKQEEEGGEEGNKHEEEEQEEEMKNEETEDDIGGGGDDEIDERDQDKTEEAGHEDEFIDEEKERQEAGEEDKEKETQVELETSLDDQGHDGGGLQDHEAREEHYKADDASSAVTHDSQIETEKLSSENLNENTGMNDLGQENKSNNSTVDTHGDQSNSTSLLGQGEMSENSPPLNATAGENRDGEVVLTKSGDISLENTTLVSLSNDQSVSGNKSAQVSTEAANNSTGLLMQVTGSSQQNETAVILVSNKAQNATGDDAAAGKVMNTETTEVAQVNDNTTPQGVHSDTNSTVPHKTKNADTVSSGSLESDASDKIIKPEVAADAEVDSGSSSQTKEIAEAHATHHENSETKNESSVTDGSTESSGTTTDDPLDSDSSVGQDVHVARIDLGTLPDNAMEGLHSRDAAAE